jgi:hypothetical protein
MNTSLASIQPRNPHEQGFTLFEILLAVLFLAIALVPMMNAFGPALSATGSEEEVAVFTNQARGTLNRILSLDYTSLSGNMGNPANLTALLGSAAEAAKENFTLRGTTFSPVVAIVDRSGSQGGLLEVSVSIQYVTLKTQKVQN